MKFNKTLINEAIPKLYVKRMAKEKLIKKLEADLKKILTTWKSATDSKKKMKIQANMMKLTSELQKHRRNLVSMEDLEDETTSKMGTTGLGTLSKAERQAARDMKNENLTEDATKDLMNGGLKTWWKYKPEEVMSFVYWLKRQTPPTGSKFNTEWESIKKQLQTKFPHNESVNEATEESQVITDLRWIVKNSQNKPVKDPITKKKPRVDLFTASAIVQVYDAINDKNKQQFITKSIPQMASIAFKVMKK